MSKSGRSFARMTTPSQRIESGSGKFEIACLTLEAPSTTSTRLRIAFPLRAKSTLNELEAGTVYCCTVHLFSEPSKGGATCCAICGFSGFCGLGTVHASRKTSSWMPFVDVTVVQTFACVLSVTCSFQGAEKSWFGSEPRPLAAFISKWIGSTKRGVVAELTNEGSE